MSFKDLPEGQTHYENDGCGEPEHNAVKPIDGTEVYFQNKDVPKKIKAWILWDWTHGRPFEMKTDIFFDEEDGEEYGAMPVEITTLQDHVQ